MTPSGQLVKARARWAQQKRSGLGTLPGFEFEFPEVTRQTRERAERALWLSENWQSLALYGGGALLLLGIVGWPVIGPMLGRARRVAGRHVQIGRG